MLTSYYNINKHNSYLIEYKVPSSLPLGPHIHQRCHNNIEASIHTMRKKFEDEDTEAILLVDPSNAVNALSLES